MCDSVTQATLGGIQIIYLCTEHEKTNTCWRIGHSCWNGCRLYVLSVLRMYRGLFHYGKPMAIDNLFRGHVSSRK